MFFEISNHSVCNMMTINHTPHLPLVLIVEKKLRRDAPLEDNLNVAAAAPPLLRCCIRHCCCMLRTSRARSPGYVTDPMRAHSVKFAQRDEGAVLRGSSPNGIAQRVSPTNYFCYIIRTTTVSALLGECYPAVLRPGRGLRARTQKAGVQRPRCEAE